MKWLQFRPDTGARTLYITMSLNEFIAVQPSSIEEADELCKKLYPILDDINRLCISHDLSQECEIDIEGVDITKLNIVTITRVIWNVHEYTRDCKLLKKCKVEGMDAFARSLANVVRELLPPFARSFI